MRTLAISVGILAVAIGFTACSRDPETLKREHFAAGQQSVKEGKLADAVIQFRNAIQLDPKFGDARYQLAEALGRTGDVVGASREYIRAADLLPDNHDAQLKAGSALLLAGRFDEARTRADAVLQKDSRNIEALMLLGAALGGLQELDIASRQVEMAIQLDPERSLSYTNFGILQLAQGDQSRAEATFRRAVELNPKSIAARTALVNLFWASGRRDEAEQTLKEALAGDPAHVGLNRLLAFLYIATDRAAQAEPYLKTVAGRSNDPSARVALADYYRATGRTDEAVKELDRLAAQPAGFAIAMVRRATLSFERGEKQDAYLSLDRVFEKDARNLNALIAKAEFLRLDQRLDDALATAQAAVTRDTTAIPAHFVLGRVQATRGNVDAAVAAYTEALHRSPRLSAAQMEIAKLYLSAGRFEDALRSARDAVASAKTNPDAQVLLARVHMALSQSDVARDILETLARDYPRSAAIQAQLGTMYALSGSATPARRAYDRALVLDDVNREALTGLLMLDRASGRLSSAQARILQRVTEHPDAAHLLVLSGQTNALAGNAAVAEKSLRRAVDLQPFNLDAYGLLGQVYISQNRMGDAIVEFETVAKQNPKSVSAQTIVGMLLQVTNRTEEARSRYQQALQIDATAPVAANNLAWLYAQSGTNLDEAVRLASTARAKLPDSPDVADTLGWALYKKGAYAEAVAAFKDAVEQDPRRALFQYHLGFASAKAGDARLARQALQRALKLAPAAPEAPEAQVTIDRMPGA